MKRSPPTRHFQYQHPVFGTKLKPAPVSKWKNTVYYYWWAYLKRNPIYIQTCDHGGLGPCADLYKDFGDVRGDDFKAWWSEDSRGMRLFAEPRAEDTVRVLNEGEVALPVHEALTVSFPLNLPKRLLERRFKTILAEHHKGKRGAQYAKSSRAKYRVESQPNIPALALGLKVWDLRQARPDVPLWVLGNELHGVLRTQKINGPCDPDAADKKRLLASAVSRIYARTKRKILSAAGVVF